MRRAVLTLSGTVAGLAALFSFRTHVPGVTPAAASSTPAGLSVSAPPTASATASASASPSKTVKKARPKASSSPTVTRSTAPAQTTPTTAPPSEAPSSQAPPKAPPTTAPAKPSGSFTGPTENTQYGAVQVRITVSNGKITDASGNLPDGGDSIGQNAIPQLNQEVLTVQSANIQAVSGATSTSEGYIASLQQAVDQAGL
jgi:uncharacterized protein with FMN-binding domain